MGAGVQRLTELDHEGPSPAPAPPVFQGTLLDRFAIGALASRGGMGSIYRGNDTLTGRPVAIKWIGSTSDTARRRFLREGRILSDLQHARIVKYLAHGATADGTLFLVMDWLEGEDLASRLARGPLSVDEALALVRGACEGLAVAHGHGVVHRDVKPGNLFLEGGDPSRVKLLDFGVALFGETVSSLSADTSLIGTFGYMSPEQVLCERDVDARADVFAAGCVLYECLTGVAPFASAHAVGVLAKVLREEPRRPSELRSGIGSALDDLVARLLAKSRTQRPASAAGVIEAIDALGAPSAGGSVPPRRLSPSVSRLEQRIITVILVRPASLDAPRLPTDSTDDILDRLSLKFDVEVAALQGGVSLLVLTGRGPASDRASQAALCALDLLQSRSHLLLAIATGLADTSGRIPVGSAIDRAAALLEGAIPVGSGVYIDDVTTGLIGNRFDVKREGQVTRLLGTRANLDVSRLLMGRPTPCVGRDRELGMLDGVLEECVGDGVSRAVLVTGAPGIGKSRLAAEWLSRHEEAEHTRMLYASADQGGAGSALLLVQQLVRDAVGLREAEAMDAQRGRLLEYLAGHPEIGRENGEFLGELLKVELSAEPSPALGAARASPDIMQERVRRALHAWMAAETARSTVVVILEDLHWGDAPSVAFLSEALLAKLDRRLMVVALARPGTEITFPRLAEQAALRIRLMGLSARACQQLIRLALSFTPEETVVSRIVKTADGNPFYLEELIRRVAAGSTDWPDSVLAMAQSRIEELDYPYRRALRAASVFGERAWDLGVQEMLEPGADARTLLADLARDEVLVEVPDSRFAGAREYRFRHALLRDAAYGTLVEEDRRACHAIAGAWLERSQEKDGRVLADHFEAAGLREHAVPWLIRAAKAAIDAGDIARTIQLANRGVSLGARGVERGRLLLARAYAEAQRGEPDIEVAREALALLESGSAPWWLALATLIFACGMQGKPEQAEPYLLLAHEASFGAARDVPFGQGLVTLVGGLVLLGKSDVAELLLERVSRTSESPTPPEPIFEAFMMSARCAMASVAPIRGKWRLEQAYFSGRAAITTLNELGAVHGESVALYYLAAAAIHLGLYGEALAATERSIQLTLIANSSINDGWPQLFRARALLRLGRPDEALDAVSALGALGNRIVHHMLPVIRAEALLRKGAYAEAETEAAPACSGISPRLRRLAACVSARAQLELGRPGDALTTVEMGLGRLTTQGLETDIELLTLRAEALLALQRRDEALAAMADAADFVRSVSADIADETLRESFIRNVEPCARALALAGRWLHRSR